MKQKNSLEREGGIAHTRRKLIKRYILIGVSIIFLIFGAITFFTSPVIEIEGESYRLDTEKTFHIEDGELKVSAMFSSKLKKEIHDTANEIWNKYTIETPWRYQYMINSSKDDYFITALNNQINQLIEENKTSLVGPEANVIYAVELVQRINYDDVKRICKVKHTKMPYETLYTKSGVCRETSLVLVRMLEELGYETALVYMPKANHIIVGLKCDPSKKKDFNVRLIDGYCLIDTTAPISLNNYGYSDTNIIFRSKLSGNDYNVIPISKGKTFEFNYTKRTNP